MKQQQQESFVNIFSGSPESPESKNQRIKESKQNTKKPQISFGKKQNKTFMFFFWFLGQGSRERIIGWL